MCKEMIGLVLVALASTASAQWRGEVVNDAMTGERAYVQWTATSSNSLALAAPYEGKNHGTLIQRIGKVPGGMSLVVAIDKGQFVCPISGCNLRIRYDDKQPISQQALPSADGSPNVLTMNTIVDPKANRILVEALVYQAGPQVLAFDVPGGAPR